MAAAPPSPLDEPALCAGTDLQLLKEHVPVNTTFHFNVSKSAACPDLSGVQLTTDGNQTFEERPPKTETTNSASQNSASSAAHPYAPNCERLDLQYQPRPVDDVAKYNAFPAVARQREIVKAATNFAGNARNIFVHYTEPVLQQRRREVLATGRTKKLFTKTAAQLWPTLAQAESFFWNQKSVELRLALKQGSLSLSG
ncbi:hypothetical protein Slin15195_G113030 [Septoria linicola]|uniref:Uncharacterized protein n=1 Tax=Septoria linicola TaxID=215465 RepID=A0A9Q9AZC6_9PEZI|nr:hypothetical protein Slin15195_G113030 [Septoria linicola]